MNPKVNKLPIIIILLAIAVTAYFTLTKPSINIDAYSIGVLMKPDTDEVKAILYPGRTIIGFDYEEEDLKIIAVRGSVFLEPTDSTNNAIQVKTKNAINVELCIEYDYLFKLKAIKKDSINPIKLKEAIEFELRQKISTNAFFLRYDSINLVLDSVQFKLNEKFKYVAISKLKFSKQVTFEKAFTTVLRKKLIEQEKLEIELTQFKVHKAKIRNDSLLIIQKEKVMQIELMKKKHQAEIEKLNTQVNEFKKKIANENQNPSSNR